MADDDHLDARLRRWLAEGELSGKARVGAIAHLANCSTCRTNYEEAYGPSPVDAEPIDAAAAAPGLLLALPPDAAAVIPQADPLRTSSSGGFPFRRSQPPPALVAIVVGVCALMGFGALVASWVSMFTR